MFNSMQHTFQSSFRAISNSPSALQRSEPRSSVVTSAQKQESASNEVSVCPYWASKQASIPAKGISAEDMKSTMLKDKIGNSVATLLARGAAIQLADGDMKRPIPLDELKNMEPIFGAGTLLRTPSKQDMAFEEFAESHPNGCSLQEFARFQKSRFNDQKASALDRTFRLVEAALWIQRAQGGLQQEHNTPQITSETLRSLANRDIPQDISAVTLIGTLVLAGKLGITHWNIG